MMPTVVQIIQSTVCNKASNNYKLNVLQFSNPLYMCNFNGYKF
jgi:hypothetical protein